MCAPGMNSCNSNSREEKSTFGIGTGPSESTNASSLAAATEPLPDLVSPAACGAADEEAG